MEQSKLKYHLNFLSKIAVGQMAYMKRRKLWKTGKDGLCCSSSAIQTLLDPSSLPEERSEIPIVLLFLLCFSHWVLTNALNPWFLCGLLREIHTQSGKYIGRLGALMASCFVQQQ